MSKRRILLLGGGGHCRSVLDSLLALNEYDDIGIIDISEEASVGSIPVVGNDSDLFRLFQEGWKEAFITVGSIGSTSVRRKLFCNLKELNFNIPSIIDPSAILAKGINISEGTFIGKGAIINSDVKIGKCAIINSGAIIEHNCLIGDFCHISTGASLCGQVFVGSDSHIGASSVIRQNIHIGKNALIGIGSVVVNDISDNVKAFGNPCKVVD